jgi:group I intron endonuclease
MYVYKIVNVVNGKEYIGITNNLQRRWNTHVFASKIKQTPLYAAMRKYGIASFTMQPLVVCPTREYACEIEVALIAAKQSLYNLAEGGEGGYVVPENKRASWLAKLRISRVGATPFLGKAHNEETKAICRDAAKAHWVTKGTYNAEEIVRVPFKVAKEKYGISKTHYYRLKRRMSSDHA